jgi:hypothetical protein
MSSYKAIAAVSSTLRNLLSDRMEDLAATMVAVTLAPPDVTVAGVTGRRVNLYLFQVTENASLKNQEIPGSGSPGAYGHPPLSLNLHYLLTAFPPGEDAADADLAAQQILGNAMRVLHDYAIVPPDLHREDDPLKPLILDPVLANARERIKIVLQPIPVDELSKLWSALPKSNFRRSVAYEVSVVQIESRRTRRVPAPVKTRRVHVQLSRRPEITTVFRTPLPGEPSGDPRVKLQQQINVEGSGFLAAKVWVRLGGLEPIRVNPVSDALLQIAVPDAQYPVDADHPVPRPIPEPRRLQPGPQTVEVLVERATELVGGGLDRGATGVGAQKLSSNQSVFLLVPEISSVAPPEGTAAGLLTVQGRRLFRDGLTTLVLVGDAAIEVRKPQGSDPWAAPTDTSVQVPLQHLALDLPQPPPAGDSYPVRVLVDGAQNLEEGMTFLWKP